MVDSDPWKAVECGVVFLVHFAERHLRKGKLRREEGGVDCPEVTKSILFCWLFTIKDRCKEVPDMSSYLCSSGSSTRGKSRAVSAQKALQGSEMETKELLGGTEEKSISPIRSH